MNGARPDDLERSQVPQRIARALDELSETLGIAVTTPEFEILLSLLRAGSLGTDELCGKSSLSRSGFFHALDRLKHQSHVVCHTSTLDRRCKRYSLNPATATKIEDDLRLYRRMVESGSAEADPFRPVLGALAKAGTITRFPNVTCEYLILVYLFLSPGSATGEISQAVPASATRFHLAMRTLLQRDLIVRTAAEGDRRRRIYVLAERVRQSILRANSVLFSWLDGNDGGRELEACRPGERKAS